MLDECRKALRISGNDFDSEIKTLIDACKEELSESGIKYDNNNYLHRQAIITYVKRDFGWDNQDYDKLNASYNSQKIFLIRKQQVKDE